MVAYPKSQQLHNNRQKKTAKQRGSISAKVTRELYERSCGICEHCHAARGAQRAHLERRWKLMETTVNDLAHLCVPCHLWADQTGEGRKWLIHFKERLCGNESSN